jgi:archaellum component FlaC
MKIESENDFGKVRDHVRCYLRKFPAFKHDVRQLEDKIEKHISEYSQSLVMYRQTRQKTYLTKAQNEIESINKTIELVEKIEVMAYLSQR